MKLVKDDTPFNKIVIPGTHDSLTYDWEDTYNIVRIYTGYWAKTQYLSTRQQLDAGVRYVDARVGYDKASGKVVCFHGDFTNYNDYSKDIDELSSFITQNPSEVIVWKLHIYDNEPNARETCLPLINDFHKKLNFIPVAPNRFSATLSALRDARPDKTRGGIILVSPFQVGPEGSVWSNGLISDPYDESAPVINKDALTMSNKKPTEEPLILKSTMKKIYSTQKFPEQNLSVMQMIAVYNTDQKSSLIYSVESISANLNSMILTKTIPDPPPSGYNVIMIDFLTPQLAAGIIDYNLCLT
jgi:1-phosphatidylinositol phosphodiesterase